MNLRLVTAPAQEPITLNEVQGQVRLIDLSSESETVQRMIIAVRERAEAVTRRSLISQQWELSLDKFPLNSDKLFLPLPPLQTVDLITYFDTNNVETILDASAYRVEVSSEPGYIKPVYNNVWPIALNDTDVIKIKFTCGYGPIGEKTSTNIPKAIEQWMLLNIANLFENRESVIIGNGREAVIDLTQTLADGLLESYRIHRL